LNILKEITKIKVFKKRPIVLMHIGSAGSNFENWKDIANCSVLVSVDGNKASRNQNTTFLKEINDASLISNKNGKADFYITKDPNCSSLLKPNMEFIKNWYLSHRLVVKKKIKVNTISINDFLKKNKINYIDWLVIDAQGMDLKIIKSIKNKIKNNISVIDIEPGFFDFYKNEDKISDIFEYMRKNFEFNEMKFGKSFRISNDKVSRLEKKLLFMTERASKIYSNVTFLNNKTNIERINLIKLIYLLNQKKFFEAREYAKLNLINKNYKKKLIDNLNLKINLKKIIFIFIYPVIFLKKILNKDDD
tara:strand:- start:1289 stop:2203 length:915 start_codon:yes stop_codon:yes gene_type:complete